MTEEIDTWDAPRKVTYICEVPPELGRVTKLRSVNGKVIAETKSGIQMIVPTSLEKK